MQSWFLYSIVLDALADFPAGLTWRKDEPSPTKQLTIEIDKVGDLYAFISNLAEVNSDGAIFIQTDTK